jgi:hypothetical protein
LLNPDPAVPVGAPGLVDAGGATGAVGSAMPLAAMGAIAISRARC